MMRNVILVVVTLTLVAGETDELYKEKEEVPSTLMPHLLTESSLFQITAGNTVVLPCEVDDLGDYVLLWKLGVNDILFFGTMPIVKDKRFKFLQETLSLEISNVQPEDSGEYICQITSRPSVEVVHTLDVLYPPKVNLQQDYVTVREDDTIALVCNATGNPQPDIIWKHLGKNYKATSKNQHVINKAQKNDAGEYECVADNQIGDPASGIITVDVISAPKIFPEPKNGLRIVNEGETISISCQASGDPTPVITWKKPGDDKTHRGRDGDRIIISQAERNHAGDYECIATNSVGIFTSALITVQVLYPPEIEVLNSRIYAGETTAVNITCKVQGEPIPSVTWKRSNEKLVPSNGKYHVKKVDRNHILEIHDLMEKDFGEYQCTANNSLGNSSRGIRIIGIPQIPVFTSKPHGSQGTRYTLTWMVKSHNPIDDYNLIYRKKAEGETVEWTSLTIPANNQPGIEQSQTYQLTSLDPETSYEAVVKASNKFGWSKPSDTLIFTTKHEENRSEAMESSCSSVQCTTFLMIFGFISIAMFSSSTPYQRNNVESKVTN